MSMMSFRSSVVYPGHVERTLQSDLAAMGWNMDLLESEGWSFGSRALQLFTIQRAFFPTFAVPF